MPRCHYIATVICVDNDDITIALDFIDHQGRDRHWTSPEVTEYGYFTAPIDDAVNMLQTKCSQEYQVLVGVDCFEDFEFVWASLRDTAQLHDAIITARNTWVYDTNKHGGDDATSCDNTTMPSTNSQE